ncbi:MAG: hypothetical protein ABF242_04735 [Flavobacteriales bacterium]
MNRIIVLITFLAAFVGFGQDYSGSFETLNQDGLHSFLLSKEVRSATHENLNQLRILDSKKKEVPYVLVYDTDKISSVFKSIPLFDKKVWKDSVTSITIENATKKIQSKLTFRIANTSIRKSYTIFGSNDNKEWFGLVTNQYVSGLTSATKTTVERTFQFPLNTYQFLRIDFNDKTSLPINILEVGVYESKFFAQKPIEINEYGREIKSIKKRKVTRLKFSNETALKVNVISFDIENDFFLREAKIIVKKKRKVKKREETYEKVISQFTLNSKKENTFELSNLNENEFWIEIENQDNPELKITNVKLYQNPIYLVSNLKKNEKYELIIDKSLQKPSYDLGNFISDKTNTIDDISLTQFSKIKQDEEKSSEKNFWQTPLFMWICIGLGGLIVVYFALGLLKDIKN